ncbi:hypothetical protein L6452_32139 [Arctium lappa]|uniref:Uncharacterized protein n=1 Tax=Arctium lappa TaxID=4217 RepID=A0ACB8Z4V8_ARCLA|nr:hypothetical protein L6452_32139 [Arctium lappa]
MENRGSKGHTGEKERRKETTVQSLLEYAHNHVERNEATKHDCVKKGNNNMTQKGKVGNSYIDAIASGIIGDSSCSTKSILETCVVVPKELKIVM